MYYDEDDVRHPNSRSTPWSNAVALRWLPTERNSERPRGWTSRLRTLIEIVNVKKITKNASCRLWTEGDWGSTCSRMSGQLTYAASPPANHQSALYVSWCIIARSVDSSSYTFSTHAPLTQVIVNLPGAPNWHHGPTNPKRAPALWTSCLSLLPARRNVALSWG